MMVFAFIFSLAFYAKKRRIAAEKARDAIIVDTPYVSGTGMQMGMSENRGDYDEKGNPMHSIPIGTNEKSAPTPYQNSGFFGSTPSKLDKS